MAPSRCKFTPIELLYIKPCKRDDENETTEDYARNAAQGEQA
jgi:hypothetical protein